MRAQVAALVLLSAASAHAAAWAPQPGHGYAKVWMRWLPGFSYHAGDGQSHDYPAYHEISFTAYGEVGLVQRLAAIVHLPLVNVFTLADPTTGTTGLHVSAGDPTIGLRLQPLRLGRFVAAVEASVRAPIASSDPVQIVYGTGSPIPRPIGELRVGAGVWDVFARIAVGYGWDRAYVAASGAYVYRTGGFDGAVTWTAEGGGRLSERWSARVRLTRWHPLGDGTAPRAESPSGIGNGTSYLGFAVEADWRFSDRWYVGGTLEGGIAYIRRQTGGPVLSAYVAAAF